MKKIKILNKEFSCFQLAVGAAVIIFIIGSVIAGIEFTLQKNAQIAAEQPLIEAANEAVEICDKIYEKMEMSDDETFLIHKSNIEKADTAINKYYATLALLDYTDTMFINFRSEAAAKYEAGDPNDYNAASYQQELTALQNEFYQKLANLENAKEEYSTIKTQNQ